MPKVKGIEVDFSGVKLVVAPLNFAFLEDNGDRLKNLTLDTSDPTQVSFVVDALVSSLLRNYPETDRNYVRNIVDLGNLNDVMAALMDVSGLKRKAIEAGERLAQTETTAGQ